MSSTSSGSRLMTSSFETLSWSASCLSEGDSCFMVPESARAVGGGHSGTAERTCFCRFSFRGVQGEGGGNKNALVPIPVCV